MFYGGEAMRKNMFLIAVAIAVLLATMLFNSPITQTVKAVTWQQWPECVCDHYDNEAYFTQPFDMWTGSGLVGWYIFGNNYFSYASPEEHDNGYGGTNPAVEPVSDNWYFSNEGYGTIFDYGGYSYFTYGLQRVQDYRMVNTASSSTISISTDCTFYQPLNPDGSENPDVYYTQYGRSVTEILGGNQPIQQNQQTSLASTTPIQANSMFNIDVVYAYVGARTNYLTLTSSMQSATGINTLNAASLDPSLICFNVTKASNEQLTSCDAQIEVYEIQVSTDTGASENYIYTIGTNLNPAFANTTELSVLRPAVQSLTGGIDIYRMEGYFAMNWTVVDTISGTRIGSLGCYQSGPSSQGFWNSESPHTITVSIHRLGYILLNGSKISTYPDPQNSNTQVSLAQKNNGFLYNIAVPLEKMAQIDLFNPPL